MRAHTQSTDLSLNALIEEIYRGAYQLPEFQREYIWKDSNIKSLFESVLSGHPIGSLLVLETDKDKPLLAWTHFAEIVPGLTRQMNYKGDDRNPPDFLVLDGQQRLTSLAHVTHGTSRNTWYLELKPVMKSWQENNRPRDKEKLAVWIEQSLDIGEHFRKGKKADDPMKHFRGSARKMPMNAMADRNTFQKSLTEVRDMIAKKIFEKEYEKTNYKKLDIKTPLSEIENIIREEKDWADFLAVALPAITDNYFDYKIPTVKVSKDMGITGVCKVFTKINTTGIELGAFDLTVAVMYPKGIPLKTMFDAACEKYPLLRVVDEGPKRYVLHTLALLADRSPKTSSLPEVLRPEDVTVNWDSAVMNIQQACELVDEHCGSNLTSGLDRFLVYSPLISILAYVAAHYPFKDSARDRKLMDVQKLRAWYFGSGISNRYNEGTDAKQNKDKLELLQWFQSSSFDESKPSWLGEIHGDFHSTKSSAIGKAMISMLNVLMPKDLYEDKTVNPGATADWDLHHLFPKAAMRKVITKKRNLKDKEAADRILKNESRIDSVLNQAWMLASTNRLIIRDRMPSEYLAEVINNYGGGQKGKAKLSTILKGHAIGDKAFEALLSDDYDKFIDARRESIIDEMKTTGHVRNILVGNAGEDEDLVE